MTQGNNNLELLAYLDASPTPFHAVEQAKILLDKQGFVALREADSWDLKIGGRYYVVRGDASIIAFKYGQRDFVTSGIRMIGAHTDSPCLKVKPNAEKRSAGYLQLGIEVYGGALLNPWFDRDLSIAGRMSYTSDSGELKHCLIDFERAVAVVPSLAIHLDRSANDNRTVNPQDHMSPIIQLDTTSGPVTDKTADKSSIKHRNVTLNQLLAKEAARVGNNISPDRILAFDLYFYDTQHASIIGMASEFIASARLDNLLSCYLALQAMTASNNEQSCLVVLNDHEEVGSQSEAGAGGNMLNNFLERLQPDAALRQQMLANSMMLSVDNAHGIHPNYTSAHDESHGPRINGGPVIKTNANQRYATSSITESIVRRMAQEVNVPIQSFVVRADMRCGSTIGPMTAAQTGIKTLDLGVPTFAMHSIRELAGVADTQSLNALLVQFLDRDHLSE